MCIANTLRVSADPAAKPGAHTRAESRRSRPTKVDPGERLTLCWRGESGELVFLKMPNSLLAGKIQGISSIRASAAPRRQRKWA
jgi:hypothetical protein